VSDPVSLLLTGTVEPNSGCDKFRSVSAATTAKNRNQFSEGTRVARCFILKPKIPIWVNFWRAFDWKMWPRLIFYGRLIYLIAIWYIMCTFGIFFPVLVSCPKKNLATLEGSSTFTFLNAAKIDAEFFFIGQKVSTSLRFKITALLSLQCYSYRVL
jgi:hypothetical protein